MFSPHQTVNQGVQNDRNYKAILLLILTASNYVIEPFKSKLLDCRQSLDEEDNYAVMDEPEFNALVVLQGLYRDCEQNLTHTQLLNLINTLFGGQQGVPGNPFANDEEDMEKIQSLASLLRATKPNHPFLGEGVNTLFLEIKNEEINTPPSITAIGPKFNQR